MYVCAWFLETAGDKNRCHLCLQPKKAHQYIDEPPPKDHPYWTEDPRNEKSPACLEYKLDPEQYRKS